MYVLVRTNMLHNLLMSKDLVKEHNLHGFDICFYSVFVHWVINS